MKTIWCNLQSLYNISALQIHLKKNKQNVQPETKLTVHRRHTMFCAAHVNSETCICCLSKAHGFHALQISIGTPNEVSSWKTSWQFRASMCCQKDMYTVQPSRHHKQKASKFQTEWKNLQSRFVNRADVARRQIKRTRFVKPTPRSVNTICSQEIVAKQ